MSTDLLDPATRQRRNSTVRSTTRSVMPSNIGPDDMLNFLQALLSVFKGRVFDPSREKDTAIERCDVSVEDGEGKAKSRFVIKMVCRHGKYNHSEQIDLPLTD
jgi:hypothetical protein